ncbi:hypothetical protein ABVT39_028138 [Epinephelus coioides]
MTKTPEEDVDKYTGEEVVSTEEEWDKKKAKLGNTKAELHEKIKKRKTRVDEINASLKSCKDQLENEWWDIEAVFTAVMNTVEEALAAALKPLKDRREAVEKDAKHIKTELEEEIDRLDKTISELDDISVLEDHILFLQRYPSLQDLDSFKDSTELELDTSLSFGTLRKITTAMLQQIHRELEKLTSTGKNFRDFQSLQFPVSELTDSFIAGLSEKFSKLPHLTLSKQNKFSFSARSANP